MGTAHAQFITAQTNIALTAGVYSGAELIEIIENKKIVVSYASSALTKQKVNITNTNYTFGTLLPLLFNTEQYSFIYRENKIIIQAKRGSNLKNIMGYVQEKTSSERLIGAYVFIESLKIGTTTNAFGYFSLTLDALDTVVLNIGALGYSNVQRKAYPSAEAFVYTVENKTEQLATVEVSSKPMLTEITQMSTAQFSAEFTKRTPSFLGEPDVLKTVQTLPGVQGGMEASTGIFVRGGGADQNLLLLDGVPVYNASHLFGLFSVFNADAIKNVNLIKGGFPARYGGRLSSILSIDMREGNLQEFHGNGSIGLISSRFTLEGPIVKNKMSFMVSARRTYWDLLVKGIQAARGAESFFAYHFDDVNAKVNYVLSKKDRLYLSFYTGNDVLKLNAGLVGGDDDQIKIGWGNRTSALRWNHLYSDNLFGNLTATYSRYKFGTQAAIAMDNMETVNLDYESSISDIGLKYDLEYQKFTRHKIRFGASYVYHQSKPNAILEGENLAESQAGDVNAHDAYAYAEDDWFINENLKLSLGAHYATYFVENKTYHILQPRAAVRYALTNDWSLKASYAKMAQFIHLLSNDGSGLPTDLWVSSTAKVRPQLANQVAFGSFHQFGQRKWEVSAEVFHKEMKNLITYKDGASFITSTDWQSAVESNGKGWAYGTEFFLNKLEGKTTGWVSYTWSVSEREFENINLGKRYPFKYDRRHNTSVVLNHEFSKRFDVGMNWTYATGQAFSLPTTTYYVLNANTGEAELRIDYSERNSYRYPAYHRLDISMNFRKKTKWGERTWNVSIYNVYNRQNPFYVGLNQQNNKVVAEQTSFFPFLPSIAYVFQF